MTTADVLLLTISFNDIPFSLIGIYRKHEFTVNNFLTELEPIFSRLKTNSIIMGDLNIDINKSNTDTDAYLSLMYNYSFTPLIDNYTRITKDSSTNIDHIFVRHKCLSNFKPGIFHINITDHSLVALIISNEKPNYRSTEKTFVKKINYDGVKTALMTTDWSSVFNWNDVDNAVHSFYSILNNCIQQNTEDITISNKFHKAKTKSPWITETILKKIEKRNKLLKTQKNRPFDLDFQNYVNRFKANLCLEIDNAKKAFYHKLFQKHAGNTSEQWRIVNNLTDQKDRVQITKIRLEDGRIEQNPQAIANLFNDYFVSVAQQLITSPPGPRPDTLRYCQHQPRSLFLNPVTHQEISSIIKSLKNKKSTGCDNISTHLIKFIEPEISKVLAFIVNLSFLSGKFPTKFKQATVVPIFKKGDRELLQNHRPIALLCVFSKVFERCMKARLLSFLNKVKFFSPYQFGFTEGKSTETAITTLMENVLHSINNNNKSSGIFIDFSKAFDLVDHGILLEKLKAAGVRGVALDWFESYLTNRTQKVNIANITSNSKPVSRGVPQGSVLSATMFLIFVNDLLCVPFKGRATAFADDIALQYNNTHWTNILEEMKFDIRSLKAWCENNNMIVNAEKTKFINFGLKRFSFDNNLKFHVNINCENDNKCKCPVIEQVNQIKYLGIIIDESLSWKPHTDNLQSQLRRNVRKFYFLRNLLPEAVMRTLYFALIHSRFIYGIEIWGGASNKALNPLEIIQKHFIRIITFKCKREPSLPLFRQLKILPLKYLFVFKVLKTFYMRSGDDNNKQFKYYTRAASEGLFKRPKVYKSFFRKSFVFLGPKLFNLLPNQIKIICKKHLFKKKNWNLVAGKG
ncbi:hypothetical protein J6590_108674 [Homalodisca vitripennis]|nr:hypothetical protein J6590_108674 [Homalodisca vitripennis]